jgi:hypothetical protein
MNFKQFKKRVKKFLDEIFTILVILMLVLLVSYFLSKEIKNELILSLTTLACVFSLYSLVRYLMLMIIYFLEKKQSLNNENN